MKKRILIFGGSSFFSYNFFHKLKKDFDIILVENRKKINLPVKKLSINKKNFFKEIKDLKIDLAINAIGLASVDRCEINKKKANYLNNLIAKKIAIELKKLSIKLIHISTDHIFDGKKSFYKENDKTKPLNEYAKTKLNGEKNIIKFYKNSLILRVNFIGWDFLHRDKFLDKIIKKVSLNEFVQLPKNIFFNPISFDFFCSVLKKIILEKKSLKGIYHLSANDKISKYKLVTKVLKKLGFNQNLIKPFLYKDLKISRPLDMSLSNKKLKKKLKIKFPNINQVVTSLIADFNKRQIPYGKHSISLEDIENTKKVFFSESLTQGKIIDDFEEKVKKYVGAKYAVAVSSCSAGLHLSLKAIGLKKNEKVITSPITFVSTANAALHNNLKVMFCDIDENNICIDLNKLEEILKSEKIKCVIPVHFSGVTCNMKKLFFLSKKYNFKIVEDCAHALGSFYTSDKKFKVGSCKYSDISIFSFHPVKLIAAGEGGVITTNNQKVYRSLLRLRSHGINKLDDEFLNDKEFKTKNIINPWYYEMQDLGFHYRITDLQCQLGLSQMLKIKEFLKKRKKVSTFYDNNLNNLKNLKILQLNDRKFSANHLYVVSIDFKKCKLTKAELMTLFKSFGMVTQVHYIPVPMHPFYKKMGYSMASLDNAKLYYDSCLSLPIYNDISIEQQKYVVNLLKKYVG